MKIQIFFRLKPSPAQYRTNKKRIIQIGLSVPKGIGLKQTNKHCYKDLGAIYKGCMNKNVYILVYNIHACIVYAETL